MSDITVQSTTSQVENRSWLLSPHGTEPGTTPSVTLDITKFTSGTHYPNGYIKSGTVLGKVTASGLYGPYDDAASDGRQTAVGILFSSENVLNADGSAKAKVSSAMLVHGFVAAAKLVGIDANGQTDLKLIHFA